MYAPTTMCSLHDAGCPPKRLSGRIYGSEGKRIPGKDMLHPHVEDRSFLLNSAGY